MLNPLQQESHTRLATEMVERAAKLPKGRRVAVVMPDGPTVCFGNERDGKGQNVALVLQHRLFERGVEPTALAFSADGSGWVIVAMMPAPGRKWREVEAELDELLRSFRPKGSRRRGRPRKASARRKPSEPAA